MSIRLLFLKVSPPIREFAVCCAILVAVIAARGFSLAYPVELSDDESELLVQIDCYERDLMPWRSVDGSTIGPVNPWFLLAMKQTGWPISYSGIHFLSAVLQALIALVSYCTVRLFLPFGSAWLVALAGTVALAGCASINFMYFATELVPALTLALAVFALVWARLGRPVPLAALTLAAALAGTAPWAKLQAAPMAAVVCALAVWTAWTRPAAGTPSSQRLAALALVATGAALPSLLILVPVTLGGVFPDFWASYIVANLGYAGSFTAGQAGSRLVYLLTQSKLNGLMLGLVVLAGLRLFAPQTGPKPEQRTKPGLEFLVWLYLAAAVFACIRPPHGFGHYHIFLISPLFVALGVLLSKDQPQTKAPSYRTFRATTALGVLIPTVTFAAYYYYVDGEPLRQHLSAKHRHAAQGFSAAVTREIKTLAPGASNLVVWGWMPALHLSTHLRSASRHTISHFLIDPGPSRERFRRQFLQEVQSSRPDVIVDAVASDCYTWYWPVESSGIESFPEFAAYVQAHYTLARSIVGDQAGVPLRIFVRKPPGPAGS